RPAGHRVALFVDEGPGQAPAELLVVDVDGLPLAVVVLDAARHALGERRRERLAEQPVRLDEVGIAGVGPDEAHGATLRGRATGPGGGSAALRAPVSSRARSPRSRAQRRRRTSRRTQGTREGA